MISIEIGGYTPTTPTPTPTTSTSLVNQSSGYTTDFPFNICCPIISITIFHN